MGWIFQAAGMTGQGLLAYGAGKAAEADAKTEVAYQELASVQREADRKSALADALASQNASAGARNVAAFEGSPLTIMQEDIRREQVATERDKLDVTLRNKATTAKAEATKHRLILGSIFGAASSAGQMYEQNRTPRSARTTTTSGPSGGSGGLRTGSTLGGGSQ